MNPFGTGSPAWLISAALAVQGLFPSATAPVPYQQTELRPYVRMFEVESFMHGHMTLTPTGLTVSYMQHEKISVDAPDRSALPYWIIGYCFINGINYPTILIDKDYWANAEVEDRMALVFHELGHCALYREHEDSMVRFDGHPYPGSIMHSSLMPGLHWWRYMDYYLDELFLGENRDPLVW